MSVNLLSKSDLLKSVSEKSGVSVKDSNAVISALADTVSEEVADGRTVQIIGIGRIARRWRAERTARNPQNGQQVKVPAKWIPAMTWSSKFKNHLGS